MTNDKTLRLSLSPPLWQWKRLAVYFLLAALLFGSWLFAPTRMLWDAADDSLFRTLNGMLRRFPSTAPFWAFMTRKRADWICDAVFLAIALAGAWNSRRPARAATLLFIAGYLALWLEVVTRWIERLLGPLHDRLSPSLACPDSVRLSQLLPWRDIKDASPWNHAFSFFLLAALCYALIGKKSGRLAWLAAALCCLPRLVSGAHWLTDQLVGSAAMTLLACGLALATPLSKCVIASLDALLHLSRYFKKRKSS